MKITTDRLAHRRGNNGWSFLHPLIDQIQLFR